MEPTRKDILSIEKAKYKAHMSIIEAETKLRQLEVDLKKEAFKGNDGYTPVKGKDYFTEQEIQELKESIAALIPTPKDGEDAVVDYDYILGQIYLKVVEAVSKIPRIKGDKGDKGDTPTIDIDSIVKAVIKLIPEQKDKKIVIDRQQIIDLIDDRVKKNPQQTVRVGGSVASIRALTDVDISRLPVDSQGNFIFNRYNLTVDTVAPSSPQVNDLWVDTN